MNLQNRLFWGTAALLFFYLFVLQIWAIWPFTIDDMYISLRYARHLTEGHGLSWNVQEPPVEGYSNFLFVVLGSGAIQLGLKPVVVLKLAGALGLLLTGFFVYKITRSWLKPKLAILPCIWLLFYQGQILWAISGLETSCYQAMICGSIYFIFRAMRARQARDTMLLIAGSLLALSGLMRPEAPALMMLFLGIFFISYCLNHSNMQPVLPKSLVYFVLPFFIIFMPYFIWRWHYFGQLFPNPVYCKSRNSTQLFVLNKQYLQLIWPFMLLALPAIWQSVRQKDVRHWFLWLPSLLYFILLTKADPIVAFENRLFLTAFACLLPLSLVGLHGLLKAILKRNDEVLGMATILAALFFAFFFIPSYSLSQYRQFSDHPVAGEALRQRVVAWILANTTANSRVVLADSGFIPYHVERPFIDSYCLNNRAMSKDSSQQMYQKLSEVILNDTLPEVIILTSLIEGNQVTYTPADKLFSQQLAQRNDYTRQASYEMIDGRMRYRYEIFQQNLARSISPGEL